MVRMAKRIRDRCGCCDAYEEGLNGELCETCQMYGRKRRLEREKKNLEGSNEDWFT